MSYRICDSCNNKFTIWCCSWVYFVKCIPCCKKFKFDGCKQNQDKYIETWEQTKLF